MRPYHTPCSSGQRKSCKNCNREFFKSLYCRQSLWESGTKFCSKKCFDWFRRGKPSPSPKTTFKKGHSEGVRFGKDKPTHGKYNCKWKGGITPINEKIRKSKAYKVWREIVFQRDDYTCQECEKRGVHLHADHILPFSQYPLKRLDISNGRTLCVQCHRKTPTYGGNLKGKFKNRVVLT